MATSNYRDLPGARYLPGAPALKTDDSNNRKGWHIVTKIALIVSIVSLVAVLFIQYSTNNVYVILHSVLLTTIASSIFVISLCVLIMMGLRKISKSHWLKLALTCLMVLVICFAATFGYTFTFMMFQISDVPVEYIDNEDGTSIVIMRAGCMDENSLSSDTLPQSYTAYQMCNKFMYFYNEVGHIYAPGDYTPEYEYEWLDGYFHLYLPEHEGFVNSEVFVPLYDLDDLETSIEARYNEAASATAAPVYQEYAEVEPTAEPSPFGD